jgi:hypothetical protein
MVEVMTLLNFIQEVTGSISTGIPNIFGELSAAFLISCRQMPGYSKGKILT